MALVLDQDDAIRQIPGGVLALIRGAFEYRVCDSPEKGR